MKIVFLLVFAIITVHGQKYPKIATRLGKIIGTTCATRAGRTIYTFRGIKYAEAPRFQSPIPIYRWRGIYKATNNGPACPQPKTGQISEDCLFLNVYTTQLPTSIKGPRLPVIVFIHPGAFYSGSASSTLYSPEYLLDEDVVLVTFNYRLASLGFLSTGTKDAPGNYGLKDQVEAFKWVQRNIASFGGNPQNVTLYGYSAGSWSISLHLVSPMSRGLFHKVIMGSGTPYGQIVVPTNQTNLAIKQARAVGCPVSPIRVLVECLKQVPAKDLGNSLDDFWEFGLDPGFIWYPVIEPRFEGERFLAKDPVTTIKKGNFARVPIMAGITENEIGFRAYQLNDSLIHQFDTQFDTIAPIVCHYERDTPKSREVSQALRDFYFGNKTINNGSLSELGEMYADSVIGFPEDRFVNLVATRNSQAIYYYQFTYHSNYSVFTFSNGTNMGPVHYDDLNYVLYDSRALKFFNQTEYPESKMVDIMIKLFSNFAKTGNPVSKYDELLKGIQWEPYNTQTKKYLNLGNEITLEAKLRHERYAFWNKQFPI